MTLGIVSTLTRLTQQVLKRVKVKKSVHFSNERLYFCYADIAPHNFLITTDNQLCIIDFEHAAFLPGSFISFVFHLPRGSSLHFVKEISNRVQFPELGNLEAMNWVAYHFTMGGSSSLG